MSSGAINSSTINRVEVNGRAGSVEISAVAAIALICETGATRRTFLAGSGTLGFEAVALGTRCVRVRGRAGVVLAARAFAPRQQSAEALGGLSIAARGKAVRRPTGAGFSEISIAPQLHAGFRFLRPAKQVAVPLREWRAIDVKAGGRVIDVGPDCGGADLLVRPDGRDA